MSNQTTAQPAPVESPKKKRKMTAQTWTIISLIVLLVMIVFVWPAVRNFFAMTEQATAKADQGIQPVAASLAPPASADSEAEILRKQEIEILRKQMAEAKESSERQIAQLTELTKDQAETLQKFDQERDKVMEDAKKMAVADLEETKNRVNKTLEETLPGEARVIVEQYDPAKHKEKEIYENKGKVDFNSNAEPVFEVKSSGDRVKTKNGLAVVRPVLAQDGRPLGGKIGYTPKLKDPSLKPYRLEVWKGNPKTNSGEWLEFWFAK